MHHLSFVANILLACIVSVTSQLTSRQCSANSSVVDSRCSYSSDLVAANACSSFCAASTQTSTALYTRYCASPSSCVVGSDCNIEACNVDLSGPGSVEVPCDYGLTPITGAVLTITNNCGSLQIITKDLIYSSNLDGRHLIDIDSATGAISRAVDPAVTENVTQIYEITVSSLPNLEVTRSINITFHFGSCVIGLVGPSSASVCAGYAPTTDPNGRPYNGYPQLTFQATNVPPALGLIWDLPSDSTPVAGSGATSADNFGIYSPTVLSGDEAAVFVSNMNVVANIPETSTTGIYGAGNNLALPCDPAVPMPTVTVDPITAEVTGTCCQILLFSVTPAVTLTPYQTGTKEVRVCFEDTQNCQIV